MFWTQLLNIFEAIKCPVKCSILTLYGYCMLKRRTSILGALWSILEAIKYPGMDIACSNADHGSTNHLVSYMEGNMLCLTERFLVSILYYETFPSHGHVYFDIWHSNSICGIFMLWKTFPFVRSDVDWCVSLATL